MRKLNRILAMFLAVATVFCSTGTSTLAASMDVVGVSGDTTSIVGSIDELETLIPETEVESATEEATSIEEVATQTEVATGEEATKEDEPSSEASKEEPTTEDVTMDPVGANTYGDYEFTYSSMKATVTAYNGTDTVVIVPDVLDGYEVTGIGSNAFKGKTFITEVILPDTVKTIGTYAFQNCTLLERINIPDVVTTISSYAFSGCTSLNDIVLPGGISTINSCVFENCSSLTEIVIPEKVTSISSSAFKACSSLNKVTIKRDSSVTINSNAFDGCALLEEIAIPKSSTVNSNAFLNNTSLKKVSIGEKATIKENAFKGCTAIDSISVGDGVTIASNAFEESLFSGKCGEELNWKYAIDTMTLELTGSGDMYDYKSAEEVPWAFVRGMIRGISVPKTVTSISDYAFKGCDKVTNVRLLRGIKKIGNEAFADCDSLERFDIPDSVNSVGIRAFSGCSLLRRVVFSGDAPSIGNEAFPNVSTLTIYYPETGSGWTKRVFSRFPNIKWVIWDNTTASHDIVLVLDTSGSMSGTKIENLKVAATTFVDGIGGVLNNTRIAVVEYNTNAYKRCDFTSDTSYIDSVINDLKSTGSTYYCKGLDEAEKLLQYSTADHQSIVLFSDGQPGDKNNSITKAGQLRDKGYNTFTVGLVDNNASYRQVLIDVAGDISRYFEATNVDELLLAFLNLMDDISKQEETVVDVKRYGQRYDMLSDEQRFCITSPEVISIMVSPGKKVLNPKNYVLTQNGKVLMSEQSGNFENIKPAELFAKNGDVTLSIYDSSKKLLESHTLKMEMCDYYELSYVMNYGANEEYEVSQVVGGIEPVKPEDPVREGYTFAGWFESKECIGYPFYSDSNRNNRLELINDKVLYAKWKESDTYMHLKDDAYSFTNSANYFCTPSGSTVGYDYEISSGDLSSLLNSIGNNADAKQLVLDTKADEWGGSCFGMSASVVLMKKGIIDISNFDSRYSYPGNATGLDINKHKDDDVSALESMINYYYLTQVVGDVCDIRTSYSLSNESANIARIVEKMKAEPFPVVLTLNLKSGGSTVGGHAVVAYDFKETVPDSAYTFKVYDCSMGNDNAYTVNITKTGSTYSADCNVKTVVDCLEKNGWEADWGYGIYLKTALTADDLQKVAILKAPDTIDAVGVEGLGQEEYILRTNYSDFTITDGVASASIANGAYSSGTLSVECFGNTKESTTSPLYEFKLPILADGKSYTITQSGVGTDYSTSLIYRESSKGFYVAQKAELAGKLTIDSTGAAKTEYASATRQSLKVTGNILELPWYTVAFEGVGTGYETVTESDKVRFKATGASTVDVKVNSDFNDIEFNDVAVDSDEIEVVEVDGNCVVRKTGALDNLGSSLFGYSVVFNSSEGSSVPTLKNVVKGTKLTEPMDPIREGYIFEGWFEDSACTDQWDFANDTVEKDTILYAGWSFDANYFVRVTFNMSGIEDQTIVIPKGTKIRATDCPEITSDNKTWYVDEDWTKAWNFAENDVMRNMTLYAQGIPFTVNFETNCSESTLDSISVYGGKKITEPVIAKRANYTLEGWYTDENFTKKWNFSKDKVRVNLTLYARWVSNEIDLESKDTRISIEILSHNGLVYTGGAIKPEVVVRDEVYDENGVKAVKILQEKVDYKLVYGNNKAACDINNPNVLDKNKPYVTIQGIGQYKNTKKIKKYFSIEPVSIDNLSITMPTIVSTKARDAKQLIKPVVKIGNTKVKSTNYTVSYYSDAECTMPVDGITTAGTYYIIVEAAKKDGVYKGNFTGKMSTPRAVLAVSNDKNVNKAVLKLKSSISIKDGMTYDEAVQTMVDSIKVDKVNYKPASDMTSFNKVFEVLVVDASGNSYSGDTLANALTTTGVKTITVAAKADNELGYVGSVSKAFTAKGTAIKKSDFRFTLGDTAVTKDVKSVTFTGESVNPKLVTSLKEGTDYTLKYVKGNRTYSSTKLIDVGTYNAVITGINKYQGTVKFAFTISKVNINSAYKSGKIRVTVNASSVVYNKKGCTPSFSVSYDADGAGSNYDRILLTKGDDYSGSYGNNKRAYNSFKYKDKVKYGYVVVKGKGNFTGSIRGDGKKLGALNFKIDQRSLGDSSINIIVKGITFDKRGYAKKASVEVYDGDINVGANLVSPAEYSVSASGRNTSSSITVRINAKSGKNYSSSKTAYVYTSSGLKNIAAKNAIFVDGVSSTDIYYYNGSAFKPDITIRDADGNDITSDFTITYGENIKVGLGKVYISAKAENGKSNKGYYGKKTISFTILPKWAQWKW